MIEISPEVVAIIFIVAIFAGILTGFPLAITLGGVAVVMGYLLFGPSSFEILYTRAFHLLMNYTLVAVPCFIFMGSMLQYSGIAEKMYDALYLWLGGLRGGLAIITVIIGTVLAAAVGIIAASIAMLALVALPAMVRRGYDKSLACGAVVAGGCLGILIPPSVMLVLYGPMAWISVGKLFMAAFFPGFMLSILYCSYIAIRCRLQPDLAPAIPAEERRAPFMVKTVVAAKAVLPTALLILAVLGVIFLGIAPPTEASASGAVVATVLAVVYRRFSWRVLRDTALETLRLTAIILLIGSAAFGLVGIFISAGGAQVVEDLILATPGGRWGSLAAVMFLVFLLGFFIDWIGILFIIVPIISPLAPAMGFDPLWFAIMVCVNLQASFMTPPFAPGIFFLRGTVSPDLGISMEDIIRGVIPFALLVLVGVVLLAVFPEIALWLPAQMIK
ncbi:MAG: TRAP transporter large permease subunit [Chloroflexota bacterium]|nr:TRAP transporter large permease subunit [Chloroflexota bacterium]